MLYGGHTSGTAVAAVTTTFTAVAFCLTVARLCTRGFLVHNLGVDDALVVLAVVLSSALTTCMVEQVTYGMGHHYDSLDENDKVMSLKWFWASVWLYYLGLWSTKTSILFQYLRILPEHSAYRKICYTLMALVTLYTFWAFFSAMFACVPIASFWDQSVRGFCLSRLPVWFSNAAFNIATDFCTAVLPLPVLNTLRIPRKQRILLMMVFGLGFITCIISVLRLQSLYTVSVSTDVSWDNPLAATWSSMEINSGIISSCIPPLKGLLTRIFPSMAVGDSYANSSAPTFGSIPGVVDFNKLGHKLATSDVEKSDVVPTEVFELGNRSARGLSLVPKRESSTLPPPPQQSYFLPPIKKQNLANVPQVTQRLQHWLGRENRPPRTDTTDIARIVETSQALDGSSPSKQFPSRRYSESVISLVKPGN